MDDKLNNLLREKLKPDFVPEDELNSKIIDQVKEEHLNMKHPKFKSSVVAAIMVGVLAIGSISVYATYHFQSASQVVKKLTINKSLADAFESDQAVSVNESQTTAGYKVTLMGIASGKDIEPSLSSATEDIDTSKTYAVVAIEYADGSPMPDTKDKNYQTFCLTPLVNGKEVVDDTLYASVTPLVEDGIQYELLECDNLEQYADEGVSLGVSAFGKETEAFQYDAKTGTHNLNSNYKEMQALFELPLSDIATGNSSSDVAPESTEVTTETQNINGSSNAKTDSDKSKLKEKEEQSTSVNYEASDADIVVYDSDDAEVKYSVDKDSKDCTIRVYPANKNASSNK